MAAVVDQAAADAMGEQADMQTKRPPEDEEDVDDGKKDDGNDGKADCQNPEDEAIIAATNYQSSLISHSETI